MKLEEAIEIGKSKGIEEVRCCVDNIIFNVYKYFDCKSQDIEEEIKELLMEEQFYFKRN